jgi:hypothetical protein
MAEPSAAQLAGPLLHVDEARPWRLPYLSNTFGHIDEVAQLQRKRGPLVIETYELDLLQEPKRDVIDRSPPPELE